MRIGGAFVTKAVVGINCTSIKNQRPLTTELKQSRGSLVKHSNFEQDSSPEMGTSVLRTHAAFHVASHGIRIAKDRTWELLRESASELRRSDAMQALDCILNLESAQNAIVNGWSLALGQGMPVYLMDATFLDDCRRHLIQTENEGMIFVTGAEFGGIRVLSRRLNLEYSEQSPVFVRADAASTKAALKELDRCGLRVLAWFHSHPGTGAPATSPSSIDLSHQEDLDPLTK